MASIFDTVRQKVSDFAKTINPAVQKYTQAYQKVSPYIPFAPQVPQPQKQVQQNINNYIKPTVQGAKNFYQGFTESPNIYDTKLGTKSFGYQAGKTFSGFSPVSVGPIVQAGSGVVKQIPRLVQGLQQFGKVTQPFYTMLGKAGQDIATDPKTGKIDPSSALAFGLVFGGSQLLSSKSKLKLLDEDVKAIGNIANRASKRWFNQAGKVDLVQMAKDENIVDTILGNKYKAPISELKKIPLDKKINTLFGIAMEDYRGGPKIQPGLSTSELKGVKQIDQPLQQKLVVDPVKKIINAIKNARPIRNEQEALYTTERAKRIEAFTKVGQETAGESGFYKQLGTLKGELPKAEYESLRGAIDQQTVDSLFEKVKTSSVITDFEKITAGNALAKLLGKQGVGVPTKNELSLLNDVFGEEFTQAILSKRPIMEKVMDTMKDVLSIPRSLLAGGFDMSYGLRQGIFGAYKYPKQWASAFKEQFKYFASDKAIEELHQNIIQRPTYQDMRKSGLAIMNLGSNLTKREEQFRSSLAEKIPIIGKFIRASGRAYTGFANKFRADVFDEMMKIGQRTGAINDPKFLTDTSKFINAMTGRGTLGPLEKIGGELSSVLFSPRLLASRLQLLSPLYYARLHPTVRKEALKTLFGFTTATGTLLALGKLGGFDIVTDSTNSDFLKLKRGNTRIDIMGGFQQPIVLIARMLSGELTSSTTGKTYKLGEGYNPITRYDIVNQYFENKTAPVMSFILSMMKGKGFDNQPLDIKKEIANRLVPMFIQDMKELYLDDPSSVPLGIPSFFGAGIQTYKPETPTAKAIMLDKELVKLSPNEANVKVKQLKESDPDTYEKLHEVIKERKLGLTRQDNILKQQFVKDRAISVHKEIMKLKTSEERNLKLQEYIKKGIVTDAVKEELKRIIKEGR